ncbi:MgtC/SapB family protein [Paramaledivibacter caminithermalis]|jgi:putative Mg2+ transporter-C (MgtC) family protein|uniref:Putative Mg2+ transporter-C (MgtC) family protein n=1 Tax=Paramaledivibacter caminithermalis (strain DSM 15212 / CIP 107654 / DViRD3) TaxID=1121301 RepID=A0A1M6S5Q9_PARC5|nr:MgtC/SapB family protein [Paramaledivibacter caminithermalis]SHK40030.1 putative Mg2+ transporter-C (MgtC) family protein [Paramaledivibacter caminithermalis DSM 15212]
MIPIEDVFIRIILACFLGGLIGMERESVNRPAGFRTHILVCMGSTLVMLTGIFLFDIYKGLTNLDPARLGAQVISGIGFLGAGTILREGLSVKGLTTAASLWAVACIGLAIGSGFYTGAIISTCFVFIILFFFSKFEAYVSKRNNQINLKIITINKPGQIGKIGTILGKMNVSINNITLTPIDDESIAVILILKTPRGMNSCEVITALLNLEGIDSAELI